MTSQPEAVSILQPGQVIRPTVNEDLARHLVEELYGLEVLTIKELNSYDDRNYKVTVATHYDNPHIDALWPSGYVLKVLNSMDTPKNHVDAEHEVQKLLWAAGIHCPQPVLDREGRDKSRRSIFTETDDPAGTEPTCSVNMVRLLTFNPGDMIVNVPYTPELIVETGAYIARLEKVLKNFSHPALTNNQTIWNLGSTPKLTDFLYAVKEESRRTLVKEVICAFEQNVLTNTDKFQKGVIHGDYNEQNILVSRDDSAPETQVPVHHVSGVLDFGDMMTSYYVYEAAMTVMYLSVDSKLVDPLMVGGYVLAGYLTDMSLNEAEWRVLKECACARYCQSLVLGAYSLSLDPSNDYVVVTSKTGWQQLLRMWETPKEWLYEQWQSIIRELDQNIHLPELGNII